MTRNRASAKKAGTRMESLIAAYLRTHVDDRIERRRLTGAKDRGDLSGLRVHGQRLVAEVKDCAKLSLGAWITEVEVERGNDDALAGMVMHKRRGRAAPGDQLVTMTVRDLAAMLSGVRPELPGDTA